MILALAWALACPAPEDTGAPDTGSPAPAADAGPDRQVAVGEEATFSVTVEPGASYRWSFGDGVTASGPSVTHAWTTPGRFNVVVEATDAGGRRRNDSARVDVVLTAADPAPVASSSLALDLARGRVWVAEADAGAVARIALDGSDASFHPVCPAPRSLAIHGDRVAVSCETTDEVVWLDAMSGVEVDRRALPVGARPFGIVARGDTLWVALQGLGAAAMLEAEGWRLLPLGSDPRALALDPSGAVWSGRFRANTDEGRVWRSSGPPVALAPDPGPDSDTGARGVPNLLGALAFSPDGGRLAVGGLQANLQRGVWRDGRPLTFETTARATLRLVDPATGAERPGGGHAFDDQDAIAALAWEPLGLSLWVAHPGTHTLQRLDGFRLHEVGAILHAGQGIEGLAVHPEGGTLYVHASLDRAVHAYEVAALDQTPTRLWTAATVAQEPLDAQLLLGKRIFHDSFDTRIAQDGYLRCASCHPDGRDDGLTWDFTDRGEGLRNTTSLEGRAGTRMGPLHWTGNFDEIQDFENDMRHGFGGTGFLSEADWAESALTLGQEKAGRSPELDALAAWVATLQATPRSPVPAEPGDAAIFEAAGCADCHPAPLYTDSNLSAPVRHDIGTLRASSGGRLGGPLDGLDTPTLLGAWSTGPWLHDGSAPTLEAAIQAHNGAPTDPDILQALTRFVQSL